MATPNCAQDTQVEAPDIFIVSHQLKFNPKNLSHGRDQL